MANRNHNIRLKYPIEIQKNRECGDYIVPEDNSLEAIEHYEASGKNDFVAIEFGNIGIDRSRLLDFTNKWGYLWNPRNNLMPIDKLEIPFAKKIRVWLELIEAEKFDEIERRLQVADTSFSVYAELDKKIGRLKYVSRAPNLSGFINYQIVQFATEGYKVSRCRICQDFIASGKGTGRRASRKFCSDKCRQKWQRSIS